jgi:hypothetical protein
MEADINLTFDILFLIVVIVLSTTLHWSRVGSCCLSPATLPGALQTGDATMRS